jgi:glycine/D-amino acid oxidase-like deaminating enzyme
MRTTRRGFVKTVGAGALGARALTSGALRAGAPGAGLAPSLAPAEGPTVVRGKGFDVAVVGAGVFGSWIACLLQQSGRRVALVDAYGAGNARSSSGGQTRVIRTGYGDQEIYSRWSMRSIGMWKDLLGRAGRAELFQQAGVLWMAREQDALATKTLATLGALGVPHQKLGRADLEARWPQIDFGPIRWGILEPESGFLMAFHCVQTVVAMAERVGLNLLAEEVTLPAAAKGSLAAITTRSGRTISAGVFVFACGPWLPKLFPDLLGERIFATRQEVFYIGAPPGEDRFRSGTMPVWVDFAEEIYGVPDFEGRGFKLAPDRHGPPADPDTMERVATPETAARVHEYAGRRFPALKGAPIIGTEVCQYENTSNGDFLIERHPDLDNVWLLGGGSGHGFKHGPAIGAYVAERIDKGGPVDPRFSLATKQKVQQRTVY